jgi:hypothetical protein
MASNAAFEVGELSVAQRFGVLTLLHKKLDKTDLQYYRLSSWVMDVTPLSTKKGTVVRQSHGADHTRGLATTRGG